MIVCLHFWSFRSILATEEFREGSLFYGMDAVVTEPGRVTGDNNIVCLGDGCVFHCKFILSFQDSLVLRCQVGGRNGFGHSRYFRWRESSILLSGQAVITRTDRHWY